MRLLHKVMLGFWHREIFKTKNKNGSGFTHFLSGPDPDYISLRLERIQSILVKYVDLSVSYVGIHKHKKRIRIRIKITSGWKRIQIHLVEYVYVFAVRYVGSIDIKMDSESLIFCPGRIRIIHLF